jgi:hypothetical protein
MGKSRLLDEFGKKHLLIPVNLRPQWEMGMSCPICPRDPPSKHISGFPPTDKDVFDFLTGFDLSNSEMHTLSYHRACHFLKALFDETAKTIVGFNKPSKAERIREFRKHMSEGQRWGCSGEKRLEFFGTVVADASNVCRILCDSF